jgi:DNA replication protein DnaC
MESIGDVLKKMSIQRDTSGASTSTSTAEAVCPKCQGAGFLRLDVPVDDPRFGEMIACECTVRDRAARNTHALIERSNLGPLRGKTFENFVVDPTFKTRAPRYSPESAYKACVMFAKQPDRTDQEVLEAPRIEWLVLMGSHGTGKTHLAVAIANYRLDLGRPAIFIVVPDLLDRLRATFSPSSDVTYDELFETARTTPLLILDDLGAQSSTPWAQEKLYQIINERYNRRLPTVITTNLALDSMDLRLRSRIGDANLAELHIIKAPDVRLGHNQGDEPPAKGRRAT